MLLNHTTSVSYMFMTLTAEAAAAVKGGQHNGDKQTGLQGDGEISETETNAFIMRLAG